MSKILTEVKLLGEDLLKLVRFIFELGAKTRKLSEPRLAKAQVVLDAKPPLPLSFDY